MWRQSVSALDYLTDHYEWSSYQPNQNSSLNLLWQHRYNYFSGAGRINLSLRAPFLTDNFDYSYLQLEVNNIKMIDKLELRTRVFGRYGMGSSIPAESALYMAGGSPEDAMDNKYTRSVGFVPNDWGGMSQYDVNHYQVGGGLNLRGYAGYYAPDQVGNTVMEGYKGRSGASVNAEIGFENYIRWAPRFTRNWLHVALYGFGDAGLMELSTFPSGAFYNGTPAPGYWSTLHADAGLGMAFTIKKWGFFDKAKPLTLRFDMPLFLNRPPYSNTDYATLRYVVGINRAF